jgi:hypothetical protein
MNPLTQAPEFLSPKEFNSFKKKLAEGIEIGGRMVQVQDLEHVSSMMRRMYYMIFADVYELEGGVSPYNWKDFPGILYGAYKNENTNSWFSAIKTMKDPQIAINTMRRQLSHLLQTLPKGILIHEVGAVINIEEYETRSADPSFHLEVAKGAIEKIKFQQQPSISPIYQNFDLQMSQSMKDASGIQDELMGFQKTSREPGVSVRMRQEAGIAVLYILFNNFKNSRLEGKRLIMSLVKQYVSAPEIIRIKGPEGQRLLQIYTQLNPQV